MKKVGLTMTMALLMTVAANAQSNVGLEQLQAMAEKANTTASHAAVARQYRGYAEALNAKAASHEKDVAELTRAAGASIHKWPGSASGALQKAKANAVEARKEAREASALADRHIRLAVEAQASDLVVAGD